MGHIGHSKHHEDTLSYHNSHEPIITHHVSDSYPGYRPPIGYKGASHFEQHNYPPTSYVKQPSYPVDHRPVNQDEFYTKPSHTEHSEFNSQKNNFYQTEFHQSKPYHEEEVTTYHHHPSLGGQHGQTNYEGGTFQHRPVQHETSYETYKVFQTYRIYSRT